MNTVTVLVDANAQLAGDCDPALAAKLYRPLERAGLIDRYDELKRLDLTD
jgi:hypothetical protein